MSDLTARPASARAPDPTPARLFARAVGQALLIVAVLLLLAWLGLELFGWYRFLAVCWPAVLAALLLWRAVTARRGSQGFELLLAGLAGCPLVAVLFVAGLRPGGPPLAVLPLLLSTTLCLGYGIGVILLNQSLAVVGAAARTALLARLALLTVLMIVAGALYWGVIVSARGGPGTVAALGNAAFAVLLAAVAAPLLGHGLTGSVRALILLGVLLGVLGATGMAGGGLYPGLTAAAAAAILVVALALPLQALANFSDGAIAATVVSLLGAFACLILGWDSGRDLWLELRFGQGRSIGSLAAGVLLPALAGAATLLPGHHGHQVQAGSGDREGDARNAR